MTLQEAIVVALAGHIQHEDVLTEAWKILEAEYEAIRHRRNQEAYQAYLEEEKRMEIAAKWLEELRAPKQLDLFMDRNKKLEDLSND